MKIGLCQTMIHKEMNQNIESASKHIAEACKQNAEIVILPEMFAIDYSLQNIKKSAQYLKKGEKLYDFLSEESKKYNITLIGGTIAELTEDNKIFNTCPIFKNGELIAKYSKIHLFDVDIKDKITFKESSVLSAGDKITTFDLNNTKIGIAICYDIRFAEQAIKMADLGCEIIVYPTAFSLLTGPYHWELTARARALDSQSYVCAVCPARNMELDYKTYGHSIVCDPYGQIVFQMGIEEETKIFEFNKDRVKDIREEIPMVNWRKANKKLL